MNARTCRRIALAAVAFAFAVAPVAPVASAGVDRARAGAASSLDPQPTFPVALPSGLDLSVMDSFRVSSNGVAQYGLVPSPAMQPPTGTRPRPGYVVAASFLSQNRVALGLVQDPAEFAYGGSERRADGSEDIVFIQTVRGYVVETSELRVAVQGQQVRRLDARFVIDPTLLPSCNVDPPPDTEVRYLPQTTGNIVITIAIESVWGPHGIGQITYRDGCSGERLGETMVLR